MWIAHRPVPHYTVWWLKHMRVSSLPKVVIWKRAGQNSNPLRANALPLRHRPPFCIVVMIAWLNDDCFRYMSVASGASLSGIVKTTSQWGPTADWCQTELMSSTGHTMVHLPSGWLLKDNVVGGVLCDLLHALWLFTDGDVIIAIGCMHILIKL